MADDDAESGVWLLVVGAAVYGPYRDSAEAERDRVRWDSAHPALPALVTTLRGRLDCDCGPGQDEA